MRNINGSASNRLEAANTGIANITGSAISLFAVVSPGGAAASGRIIAKNFSTALQYYFALNAGALELGISDGTTVDTLVGNKKLLPTPLPIGVGGVKNGTTGPALKLFCDGALDRSGPSTRSMISGSALLNIGCERRTGQTNANISTAFIGHAAIWDIALEDAEMLALTSLSVTPLQVRKGHLVAYYPLLYAQSPERDFSSNGNNLTVTGSPPTRQAEAFLLPVNRKKIELNIAVTAYTDSGTATIALTPTGTATSADKDSGTSTLHLTPSGTEVGPGGTTDSGTATLSFTPSGSETHGYHETGSGVLALTPSGTDLKAKRYPDAGTGILHLTPTGSDVVRAPDAGTVTLHLTCGGVEDVHVCLPRFTGELLSWRGADNDDLTTAWFGILERANWSGELIVEEVINHVC